MKSKPIIKLFFFFFALQMSLLDAEDLIVLPFQVYQENPRTAYTWLGLASSYFLTHALLKNNVFVLENENLLRFLQRNNLRFPYEFSKALAIDLARQTGARRLIWGEIVLKRDSRIMLRSAMIDLNTLRQKFFPVFEGRPDKIFALCRELFRAIAQELPYLRNKELQLPDFGLSLSEYETFIKSFLYSDGQKKIEVLKSLKTDSVFVAWTYGLFYFEQKDYPVARNYLERLLTDNFFQNRALFLLALIELNQKNYRQALNYFVRLQQKDFNAVESNNNAGVIYQLLGQKSIARQCFLYSLSLRLLPETIYNYFQLDSTTDYQLAWRWLVLGLKKYPQNLYLQKLFLGELEKNSFSQEIGSILQSYLDLKSELPTVQFLVSNPYLQEIELHNSAENEFLILKELLGTQNWEQLSEKVDTLALQNPFFSEIYYYQARALLEQKNFSEAEKNALCSFFLERKEQSFNLLAEIYRQTNQPEKLEQVRQEFFSREERR